MILNKEGAYMSFFSVIIPAYNCEKYLLDAVASIRRQSVKDMEIIIVDDGSTDTTGEICDSLGRSYGEKSDKRESEDDQEIPIYIIHQKNRGVSVARNVGINHATGQYILFLDADDFYVDNALNNELYKKCQKGYDMIICSSLVSNVDRSRYGIDMKMQDGVFVGRQAYPITGHFAACLYKRQMLLENHILFDENVHLNEDEAFKLKAMYASEQICTCKQPMYIYNITPGSARYVDKNIYDYVEAWIKTFRWLEKYGSIGREDQAKAFVRQKIVSRQLLYAKLYVQQGHSLKEMLDELKRIEALDTLKNLPIEFMIPSQRRELLLFQNNLKHFFTYAKREGWKIRLGRWLLKIKLVRRIRDQKKFPFVTIEQIYS